MKCLQRELSISGDSHLVSLCSQTSKQHARELWLVVNYENAGFWFGHKCSRARCVRSPTVRALSWGKLAVAYARASDTLGSSHPSPRKRGRTNWQLDYKLRAGMTVRV